VHNCGRADAHAFGFGDARPSLASARRFRNAGTSADLPALLHPIKSLPAADYLPDAQLPIHPAHGNPYPHPAAHLPSHLPNAGPHHQLPVHHPDRHAYPHLPDAQLPAHHPNAVPHLLPDAHVPSHQPGADPNRLPDAHLPGHQPGADPNRHARAILAPVIVRTRQRVTAERGSSDHKPDRIGCLRLATLPALSAIGAAWDRHDAASNSARGLIHCARCGSSCCRR